MPKKEDRWYVYGWFVSGDLKKVTVELFGVSDVAPLGLDDAARVVMGGPYARPEDARRRRALTLHQYLDSHARRARRFA